MRLVIKNIFLSILTLCVLSIVLCFTVIGNLRTYAVETILSIKNADFESDKSGWDLWGASIDPIEQTKVRFSIVEGDTAFENKSLKIVNQSTNEEVRAVVATQETIKVSGDKNYKLSYYFNSTSSSVVVAHGILQYQSNMQPTSSDSMIWLTDYNIYGVTNGYERVDVYFTSANDASNIKIKLDIKPTGENAIYIDKFSLVEVEKNDGSNFNGGFESADDTLPPEWTIREKRSVSVDRSVYYEGKNSLHITRSDFANDLVLRSNEKVAIKGGKEYKFSYFMRSKESFRSSASLKVTLYSSGGGVVREILGELTALSGQNELSKWQEVSIITEVSEVVTNVQLSIIISKGTSNCFIDNVTARQNYQIYDSFNSINNDGVSDGWKTEKNVTFGNSLMKIIGSSSAETTWNPISKCVYELNVSYKTTTNTKAKIELINFGFDGKKVDNNIIELPSSNELSLFTTSFTIKSAVNSSLAFIVTEGELTVDSVTLLNTYNPRTGGSGWEGAWVCYPVNDLAYGLALTTCMYRYTFNLEDENIESAIMQFTADDQLKLFVNGEAINDDTGAYYNWALVSIKDIKDKLVKGKNVIAFQVYNESYYTGLLFDLTVVTSSGKESRFFSDSSVTASKKEDTTIGWETTNYDDSVWRKCAKIGKPPCQPWNNIEYVDNSKEHNSIEIISFDLPKQVTAGEKGTLEMTVKTLRKIDTDLNFSVWFWGKYSSDTSTDYVPSSPMTLISGQNTSEWKVNKEITVSYEFIVPDYVGSGAYMLQFDPDVIKILGDSNLDNKVRGHYFNVVAVENNQTKAEVKKIEGVTRLLIDGVVTAPMLYMREQTTYFKSQYAQGMASSGVDLLCLPNSRIYSMNNIGSMWIGENKYNFDPLDNIIFETLEGAPNAKLMLSFDADPPTWWLNANISSQVVDDSGNRLGKVSYASLVWREDVANYYKAMIDYIKTKPYYSHIFGVKVSAGITYEWQHYGGTLNNCGDFSKVSTLEFRKWLTAKYGNDEELKKAWNKANVTLSSAVVPPFSERTASPYTLLLNPETQQNVIDFHLFYSECVSDSIIYLSKAVKDASDGNWIVGAYNGYILSTYTYEGNFLANSAISKVLASEYIDFLCAPESYGARMSGQSGAFMTMINTILDAGKLFFMECDSRTVFYNDNAISPTILQEWGKTYTLNSTIELMKRDFVNVLMKGAGLWWYDMGGGWFDDGQIYSLVSAMKSEMDKSIKLPSKSVAEVALIIDDDYVSYTSYDFGGTYAVMWNSHYYQKESLIKIGTSYDSFFLSDLKDGLSKDYKVYIVEALNVSADEYKALESLKKNGVTIIWTGLPNVYSDGKISAEGITKLTGINVALAEEKMSYDINIGESESYLTRKMNGYTFGKGNFNKGIVTPTAYVDDTDAVALGTFSGSKKIGLASKVIPCEGGEWTSIFSSVSDIPTQIFKNIINKNGGHIYLDNATDSIFVNEDYLAIDSPDGGHRTIRLPKISDVYDVFAKKYVAKNILKFDVDLKSQTTTLYKIVAPGTVIEEPTKVIEPTKKMTNIWLVIGLSAGGAVVIGSLIFAIFKILVCKNKNNASKK